MVSRLSEPAKVSSSPLLRYKQGWKASDFFYNSPGQPKVDINPSLRFIHGMTKASSMGSPWVWIANVSYTAILSPLLCGLLSTIFGSPIKVRHESETCYQQEEGRAAPGIIISTIPLSLNYPFRERKLCRSFCRFPQKWDVYQKLTDATSPRTPAL